MTPFSGILPVNKPVGLRSTDCVQKIRRALWRGAKIGHGGTLDSTASGVLIVLIGQATRLSNFIMSMPKTYETVVTFGTRTSTDDASGEAVESAPFGHITDEMIDSALCGFMGWRMQSPPAVSAVHIGGERAHVLARGGREVTPEPKPVCFSKITRMSGIDGEGRVSFRVDCRKGTYIRSFARDLGARLGSAGHVSALARTACGPFRMEAAKGAEELFAMTAEELAHEVTPVPELETPCAAYEADAAAYAALSCGRPVALSALTRLSFGAEPRPDSPAVIKSNKIFSICRAAKKGGTLELSPDVNIILSGGLE